MSLKLFLGDLIKYELIFEKWTKNIIFLTSDWPIHASIFCASVDTSAGVLKQHTCCEGMPFWQIKNAGLNFDRFQASTPVEKYTKLPKLNNQQCFL